MTHDLTLFADANATVVPPRRVNWPERRALIERTYPDALSPDLEAIIADDVQFERMMRDILKYAQAEAGRDGPRPNLDWDKGMASWRQITGQDFTGLPFAVAFREIARDRQGRPHALSLIASKTGISRSRVHRLINGAEDPDVEVMVAVAGAYGKKPQFFNEYRALVIAKHVTAALAANPEYSAAVYRKVAGRP